MKEVSPPQDHPFYSFPSQVPLYSALLGNRNENRRNMYSFMRLFLWCQPWTIQDLLWLAISSTRALCPVQPHQFQSNERNSYHNAFSSTTCSFPPEFKYPILPSSTLSLLVSRWVTVRSFGKCFTNRFHILLPLRVSRSTEVSNLLCSPSTIHRRGSTCSASKMGLADTHATLHMKEGTYLLMPDQEAVLIEVMNHYEKYLNTFLSICVWNCLHNLTEYILRWRQVTST